MAPEDQLCLVLAQGKLVPEQRDRAAELLAQSLRWPYILERVYAHQIYPLLYRNLHRLNFAGVPEAVREELAAAFRKNVFYCLALAAELRRVTGILEAAQLPVIVLKGTTLAQSLYGDMTLRVCADVDLLLRHQDVREARRLLLTAGYSDPLNDAFFSQLALRHGRHYSLTRGERTSPYLIELHWDLVQGSSRNHAAVRDLWNEARPAPGLGPRIYRLSREWELLYLAIHAADHGWQTLKWLVDIDELCSSSAPNWKLVEQKAEQFELDAVVSQTLAICSSLLGTAVPPQFAPRPAKATPPLFPALPYYHGASQAAFFHLYALKRRWDKVRFGATVLLLPKPSDRQFVSLPPKLSFLYYGVRPLRLLGKWGWVLLRKIALILRPLFVSNVSRDATQ